MATSRFPARDSVYNARCCFALEPRRVEVGEIVPVTGTRFYLKVESDNDLNSLVALAVMPGLTATDLFLVTLGEALAMHQIAHEQYRLPATGCSADYSGLRDEISSPLFIIKRSC